MAKVIVCTNQKGGVAKTTSVVAMSCILAKRGYRVLCVDADPQSNLSYSLSSYTKEEDKARSLYGAFRAIQNKSCDAKGFINKGDWCDIIPSNLYLASADNEFNHIGKEYMLKEIIGYISEEYDFILVDTPPSLGIMSINALAAADYIVIVAGADVYTYQGIGQLNETIENTKKYANKRLKVVGILVTKYESTKFGKEIEKLLEGASKNMRTRPFGVKIRKSIKIAEAVNLQEDITKYAPKAKATLDYIAFVDELLERIGE